MKVQELFETISEAGPASVQVKNKSGTYKRFKSMTSPGVEEWKNSEDKPKVNKMDELLKKVADIVMNKVANYYPDADPFNHIWNQAVKLGVNENDVEKIVDKAVKTHLGAKNYRDYLDGFDEDHSND